MRVCFLLRSKFDSVSFPLKLLLDRKSKSRLRFEFLPIVRET